MSWWLDTLVVWVNDALSVLGEFELVPGVNMLGAIVCFSVVSLVTANLINKARL